MYSFILKFLLLNEETFGKNLIKFSTFWQFNNISIVVIMSNLHPVT